jgi:hypothetical protein
MMEESRRELRATPGLPLQLVPDEVEASHADLVVASPMEAKKETWDLRRGYVVHGCHD